MNSVEYSLQYFENNKKRMTDTYIDLLKIPSVSTNPDHAQDMQKNSRISG